MKGRKLLSLLLTLALLTSLLSMAALPAAAEDAGSDTLTLDTPLSVTLESSYSSTVLYFTPGEDGPYTFYSSGNTVDPAVTVFETDGDTASEIGYNDDAGPGLNFLLTMELTAGKTYQLMVRNYSTSGTFTVTVTKSVAHSVTVAAVTNGTVSVDTTSAYYGDDVELEVTADDGYAIKSFTVAKTGDPSVTVEIEGDEFIMPDCDVTVTAAFTNEDVYLLKDVWVDEEGAEAAPGKLVWTISTGLGEENYVNYVGNAAKESDLVECSFLPADGTAILRAVSDRELSHYGSLFTDLTEYDEFFMPPTDVTATFTVETLPPLELGDNDVGFDKNLRVWTFTAPEDGEEPAYAFSVTSKSSFSFALYAGGQNADSVRWKSAQKVGVYEGPDGGDIYGGSSTILLAPGETACFAARTYVIQGGGVIPAVVNVTPLPPVPYIDENGEEQICYEYNLIDSTTLGLTMDKIDVIDEGGFFDSTGWYVVKDSGLEGVILPLVPRITMNNRGDVLETESDADAAVGLILCDGADLTVGTVLSLGSLHIYGQSKGTGTLNADFSILENMIAELVEEEEDAAEAKAMYAPITAMGSLSIHGGTVNAERDDGPAMQSVRLNLPEMIFDGPRLDRPLVGAPAGLAAEAPSGEADAGPDVFINGGAVTAKSGADAPAVAVYDPYTGRLVPLDPSLQPVPSGDDPEGDIEALTPVGDGSIVLSWRDDNAESMRVTFSSVGNAVTLEKAFEDADDGEKIFAPDDYDVETFNADLAGLTLVPHLFTVTLNAPMSRWEPTENAGFEVVDGAAVIPFTPGGALPDGDDAPTREYDEFLGWLDVTEIMNGEYEDGGLEAALDAALHDAIDKKTYTSVLPEEADGDLVYFAVFTEHTGLMMHPNGGVWTDMQVPEFEEANKAGQLIWADSLERMNSVDDLLFDNLEREGYELLGWALTDVRFKASDEVMTELPAPNPGGDYYLIAVWQEAEPEPDDGDYKINLDTDITGGVIVVDPEAAEPGDEVTLTPTPDDGYDFDPDSLIVTDSEGNPIELTDNGDGTYTFVMPADDVTVTGKFTAKTFTVSFDADGGSPVPEAQTVQYGGKAEKPADPKKDGYTFQYWFDTYTVDSDTAFDFAAAIERDTALKAKWKEKPAPAPVPDYAGSAPAGELQFLLSGDKGKAAVDGRLDGTVALLPTLTESLLQQVTSGAALTADVTTQAGLTGMAYSAAAGKTIRERLDAAAQVTSLFRSGGVTFGFRMGTGWFDQGISFAAERLDLAGQGQGLTDAQKQTLERLHAVNSCRFYGDSIDVLIGGKRPENFGGEILSFMSALPADFVASRVFAYFLAEDGSLERVPAGTAELTSAWGKSRFAVLQMNHASVYLISEGPLCTKDEACPMSAFDDLDPEAWYHDGVHWALERGLMIGVGEGKFAPNADTTRAMVVTMLWRYEGEPEAEGACPFADVPADAWYAPAVAWAAEKGYVLGMSETEFAPNEAITREQLAALLYRYAKAQGFGFEGLWSYQLTFADTEEISDWAIEAVSWMNMQDLIRGRENNQLAPKATATRAEIANLFQRFAALVEGEEIA